VFYYIASVNKSVSNTTVDRLCSTGQLLAVALSREKYRRKWESPISIFTSSKC